MPHKKKNADPDAIFNALAGNDEGENWSHVYARQALIENLVEGKRGQDALAHWGKQMGLTTREKHLAVVADRLTRSLSLNHRGDLFTQDHSFDIFHLSPRTLATLEKQKVAIDAACVQFWNTVDMNYNKLLQLARKFVRKDLGWRWPFVAEDLRQYCVMNAWSCAIGVPYHRRASLEPKPPVAHAMMPNLSFTTEQDLKRELARAKQEGLARIKQSAFPRGQIPKKNVEAILRNITWFCRNQIDGVSVRQLTKDYYGDPDPRGGVPYGIFEAKRLLNLAQYHFS